MPQITLFRRQYAGLALYFCHHSKGLGKPSNLEFIDEANFYHYYCINQPVFSRNHFDPALLAKEYGFAERRADQT